MPELFQFDLHIFNFLSEPLFCRRHSSLATCQKINPNFSTLQEGSQVFNDAKNLEEFFDQMLEKWLPMYAFDNSLRAQEDSDDDPFGGPPPAKKSKKMITE